MPTSHNPSYLLKRPSGFYFRYQLPKKYRLSMGCNEIQLPLHITNTKIAKYICAGMALTIKRSLESEMGDTLSKIELKAIANRWKEQQIENMEAEHRSLPKANQYAHAEKLSNIELILSDTREKFALNDHSELISEAESLLPASTEAQANTESLAYELAKARADVLHIYRNILRGIPYQAPSDGYQSTDSSEELTCLSDAFKAYQQEKIANSDWTNKTAEKNAYSVSLLSELIGDKYIQHLSKADVRELKTLLPLIPKNLKKQPQLENRPLLEIVSSNHSLDTISQSMVKQHLTLMSSFLNWAKNNGLCHDNPFSGMIPKDKKSTRENRSPLSDADISKILDHPQVSPPEGKQTKPHQFWLPRLAMYTGARIEELCQLHSGDIQTISGYHCIVITDKRPDQNLKNAKSNRVIPLHQELIEMGFLTHIDMLKNDSEDGLIFPELRPDKDSKYSSAPSKWFGRIKKVQGIAQNKTFHSFRHTMADKLRSIKAEDYLIKRILGHTTDSETHETYGSNQNIAAIGETINSIKFTLSSS